eukprot:scaffold72264_cov63-Phaeocystis_antarctica.AAC.1
MLVPDAAAASGAATASAATATAASCRPPVISRLKSATREMAAAGSFHAASTALARASASATRASRLSTSSMARARSCLARLSAALASSTHLRATVLTNCAYGIRRPSLSVNSEEKTSGSSAPATRCSTGQKTAGTISASRARAPRHSSALPFEGPQLDEPGVPPRCTCSRLSASAIESSQLSTAEAKPAAGSGAAVLRRRTGPWLLRGPVSSYRTCVASRHVSDCCCFSCLRRSGRRGMCSSQFFSIAASLA